MKLIWSFAVLLCFHWEEVSSQLIPSGTCDCATFARNNVRPKRPLVTWPAGETSCSASSVARCRLECNKFFRTFEFDALDLVCGSLHEASRVQILFGYRICKSKWHSLGLSEEPICCRKSRPIHCDSLENNRQLTFPHNAHGDLDKKKPQIKKTTTPKTEESIEQFPEEEEGVQKKNKKTEVKSKVTESEEDDTTKKPMKKTEKEDITKKPLPPKAKDKLQEETKPETDMKRLTKKGNGEGESEAAEEEYEDEEPGAEEDEKPARKVLRKGTQKPITRKRPKIMQKRPEE